MIKGADTTLLGLVSLGLGIFFGFCGLRFIKVVLGLFGGIAFGWAGLQLSVLALPSILDTELAKICEAPCIILR